MVLHIPVEAGSTNPNRKEWEKEPHTHSDIERVFKPDSNNGVILGEASSGRVDVDVDCPEALALASHFLPYTAGVLGRDSTPHAHCLYKLMGAGKTVKLGNA
jgi:hypothetical protein